MKEREKQDICKVFKYPQNLTLVFWVGPGVDAGLSEFGDLGA